MHGNDDCRVELGSVLVSLLDPKPGDEVGFHRWYERDHFYAGVMVGPWFFAGRRFVATRALKDLRYPEKTPLMDDPRQGSYLALYFVLAGKQNEAERWAVDQVNALVANGRMHPTRRQAHAGFNRHRWSVSRDDDGVPPELALDHPYAGVVLVAIDRQHDADASALERWLREEHLPGVLQGSSAALCLGLEPVPLPDDAPAYVARPTGLERRTLLLYFLEEDPRDDWSSLFAAQEKRVADTGWARVTWAAPFVPTIPGTDRYADEL